MLENHFVVPFRVNWPFLLQCFAQLHQLLVAFPNDDFRWVGAAHNTLHPANPKYKA